MPAPKEMNGIIRLKKVLFYALACISLQANGARAEFDCLGEKMGTINQSVLDLKSADYQKFINAANKYNNADRPTSDKFVRQMQEHFPDGFIECTLLKSEKGTDNYRKVMIAFTPKNGSVMFMKFASMRTRKGWVILTYRLSTNVNEVIEALE